MKSLRFTHSRSLPFLLALAVLLAAGCGKKEAEKPKAVAAPAPVAKPITAVFDTEKGAIEVEFYAEDSPKAVENFRLLAERGYYNGQTFHRIVKGFMIQGGDPLGTGMGGESAWGGTFADEIKPNAEIYRRGYKRGILAMANSGPNTNGSQFFIMHQNYALPPNYVIFGNVTQGIEVVDALAETPTTRGPDGGMSQPVKPPVLKKITIRK